MDRCILEKLLLSRGVEKIALELKVGKRRVREVREKAIAHGYLSADGKSPANTAPPLAPLPLFPDPQDGRTLKVSPQEALLSERLEWVRERLLAGWSPITIFEELDMKDVGRSSFYRFLDRHSLHDLGKSYRRFCTSSHQPALTDSSRPSRSVPTLEVLGSNFQKVFAITLVIERVQLIDLLGLRSNFKLCWRVGSLTGYEVIVEFHEVVPRVHFTEFAGLYDAK